MATWKFQPRGDSVGSARRFVGSALVGWAGASQVETVVLLTSEVVTNVVVHAGPHGPDEEIVIRLHRSADLVRVEVTDTHPGTPVVGDGAVEKDNGRGLLLLESLASTWGVTRTDAGKVVWFEVRAEEREAARAPGVESRR
ncbi:MAG: ATP-binding protein [Actinobacteria bacterium]|nr:ATP-binding protein [Actinomycetota bacterium]